MGRRKSEVSKLLDSIFEFTKTVWQVGAATTVFFALLAILALSKALEKKQTGDVNATDEVISMFGNLPFYLGALILALIAIAFGIRTYKSYRSQNIK